MRDARNWFAKSHFFGYPIRSGNSGLSRPQLAHGDGALRGLFRVVHWFMDDAVAVPGTSIEKQLNPGGVLS
jgi:hypothetical protein